jgi:3-hydroxybutyrate dehydrogenase
VTVITGGTQGIGKGIAAAFLSEGASVLISGRSVDRGEAALAELGGGDARWAMRRR